MNYFSGLLYKISSTTIYICNYHKTVNMQSIIQPWLNGFMRCRMQGNCI